MDTKVQEILYRILNSSGIPCYDYIPTNSELPYIKIDSCYYMDSSAKDIGSIQLIQYVQVFSSYKGKKELREMVNTINDLVLKGNWTNDTYTIHPELSLVRMSEHKDEDGSFYNQATIMYKFTIYE